MLSDKRKAVISLAIIGLGLTITWMGYFFHFQNMDIGKLGGPKNNFKEIFITIANYTMGKVELVALVIGSVVTICGCIFQVVSLPNHRENCGWIFTGIVLLLSSFPILHVWGRSQQPTNFNGPACIFILMNLFACIFITIGLVRIHELKAALGSNSIWITMNVLVSLGIFLGASFLLFGALDALYSSQFSAGIAILVLSFVLVVTGGLVGIVAYAKSRHNAWELETIIERQKDIRKIKKLQRAATTEPANIV